MAVAVHAALFALKINQTHFECGPAKLENNDFFVKILLVETKGINRSHWCRQDVYFAETGLQTELFNDVIAPLLIVSWHCYHGVLKLLIEPILPDPSAVFDKHFYNLVRSNSHFRERFSVEAPAQLLEL